MATVFPRAQLNFSATQSISATTGENKAGPWTVKLIDG